MLRIKAKNRCLVIYIHHTAGTGAICWGVLANNSHHSGDMEPSVLYSMLATFVFTGVSLAVYYTQRTEVAISGVDADITIEVKDRKEAAPIYIQYPFTLKRQWFVEFERRGIKTSRLYLTIIDNIGQPLLSFTGTLGAAQTPPVDFEFLDMHERKDLIAAGKCYDTLKIEKISELLNEHLK